LSATLRSLKGQPRTRTIRTPSLTQGIITINAEGTGSRFLDTYTLLDMQVKKRFQVGERWGAVEIDATLANIFNNGAVLAISNLTGGTYDQVNGLMDPRVFRLGIGYRF
jgi:outer membrane receptor protein involved in Fe transport